MELEQRRTRRGRRRKGKVGGGSRKFSRYICIFHENVPKKHSDMYNEYMSVKNTIPKANNSLRK